MKKIIPLLIILMALSACDSPRSQRSVYGTASSTAGNNLTNGFDMSGGTISTSTGTTTTTTTNTVNGVAVPADAQHCKFSTDGVNGFESSSTHLGAYTLCQSSTTKTDFYFQIKTPPVGTSGDTSVCFIPNTTSGSNSIYVGNPMCGTFPDPKVVKKISFVKYSQYSNAIINSVIFFKDTSYYYPSPYGTSMYTLDAYKVCMERLAYPYYQNAYCQVFKSVGQYILQSF